MCIYFDICKKEIIPLDNHKNYHSGKPTSFQQTVVVTSYWPNVKTV